ncbi:MAG: LamG-like jellyroll fold domain-containing protein [Myxococcota bacterium]
MSRPVVALSLLAVSCTFGGAGAVAGDGGGSEGSDSTAAAGDDGDDGDTPGGTTVSGASADDTTGAPPPGTTTNSAAEDSTSSSPDDGDPDGSDDDPTEGDCEDPSTACLVDPGLLGRYFFDEVEDGTDTLTVTDWAPAPTDLDIDWSATMSYVTKNGHTGIEWTSAGDNGSVYHTVNGASKFAALNGQTEATLEVVVALDDVTDGSRLVNFGQADEGGLLTLRLFTMTQPQFWWQHETVAGQWSYSFDEVQRVVVHLVLDTMQPEAADRLRLYVNGNLLVANSGDTPGEGQTIDMNIGNSPELAIGNRRYGGKAIDGVIYYAAIYGEALQPGDVTKNATILIQADDRP